MGKKRRFATSVVVTLAALPACGGSGQGPKTGGGDGIDRRPDGTCWAAYENHCPPDATCNPPPPQQLDCATGQPLSPQPPQGSGGTTSVANGGAGGNVIATDGTQTPPPPPPPKNVVRSPDGTCLLIQPMDCPPGASCNPPPPMRVDCVTGKRLP